MAYDIGACVRKLVGRMMRFGDGGGGGYEIIGECVGDVVGVWGVYEDCRSVEVLGR